MFIGQAPPEKSCNIPFERTRLYSWFNKIAIDKNTILNIFDFEALVDSFPGKSSSGHKIPDTNDIMKHIPTIIEKINFNRIKLIVPIGKIAIQHVFNIEHIQLEDVIGKKLYINPFDKMDSIKTVIPLPHPSGLNTWIFQENNEELLHAALKLISNEIHKISLN